jgi:hypothetical protein
MVGVQARGAGGEVSRPRARTRPNLPARARDTLHRTSYVMRPCFCEREIRSLE